MEFEDNRSSATSYKPKAPTSSVEELCFISDRLFRESVLDSGITSISIIGDDLKSTCGVQLNIFEDNERKHRLSSVMRNVQSRFGEKSLVKCSTLTMGG